MSVSLVVALVLLGGFLVMLALLAFTKESIQDAVTREIIIRDITGPIPVIPAASAQEHKTLRP